MLAKMQCGHCLFSRSQTKVLLGPQDQVGAFPNRPDLPLMRLATYWRLGHRARSTLPWGSYRFEQNQLRRLRENKGNIHLSSTS